MLRATRTGSRGLSGQDAQQAVGEVVEIVQPLAQVGVAHLRHAGARLALFLFHRRFGRQTEVDVLFHAPAPALGVGKHAIGFKDFHLFLVAGARGALEQFVDADAQLFDGGGQAGAFGFRVVGDEVRHHHARLVQPDMALGRAFLTGAAAEHRRGGVAGRQRRAFPDEGAQFGHLGQHHGDHFQRIDLVRGEHPLGLGLHHQNAQLFAEPLDRNAAEAGIDLLAGLGHVAKAALGRGVGGVHHLSGARDAAHQTLAQLHAGLVHGLLLEALRGAEFERVLVTEQVDRTHLGHHRIRGQMGDLVQPRLTRGLFGHGVAQPAKKLAAFAFRGLRHAG